MLYKFRSKASGDLIMLEANGRRVLEAIGKEPGPKGIILPEQMPAAVGALQAAITLEELQDKELQNGESQNTAPRDGLGLRQRALPFIDMLKRNHQAGHEVVWGV